MCKLQCILSLAAISIHATFSWEIATTMNNELHFYNDKSLNKTEAGGSRELTALAYDAIYNMMLFVDKNSDNASIFSFFLINETYLPLVKRKSNDNIQGIAFDPVESILFWTDNTEKSISWISLKNGSSHEGYGNVLIKLKDQNPQGIAIDSCRKYVYWSNTNMNSPSIERSRFDGSEREVIVGDSLTKPVSIAIDQRTKKLYWADDTAGANYVIESSDLDGKNRKILMEGADHMPIAIAVSKDYVYWLDRDYNSLWRVHKTPSPYAKPEKYVTFNNTGAFGIATNYSIEDQTEGVPECEALRALQNDKPKISSVVPISTDTGLFCVHGVKVENKETCKCALGYTGVRCEINVCHNYCHENGICSLTTEGSPQCRCKPGYTGERCEDNVCQNYCLNDGKCSLNETFFPVCTCPEELKGSRCEIQKSTKEDILSTEKELLIVNEPSEGWNSTRDPIIIVLSIICLLLCALSGMLFVKVVQLKKRPRIKKRIIVNKNVTPMTARPDQCEVTIENCCNMNICETPCFEPRSTIRPTLLDSKPGKEEKKNLISHMEYPDDY